MAGSLSTFGKTITAQAAEHEIPDDNWRTDWLLEFYEWMNDEALARIRYNDELALYRRTRASQEKVQAERATARTHSQQGQNSPRTHGRLGPFIALFLGLVEGGLLWPVRTHSPQQQRKGKSRESGRQRQHFNVRLNSKCSDMRKGAA